MRKFGVRGVTFCRIRASRISRRFCTQDFVVLISSHAASCRENLCSSFESCCQNLCLDRFLLPVGRFSVSTIMGEIRQAPELLSSHVVNIQRLYSQLFACKNFLMTCVYLLAAVTCSQVVTYYVVDWINFVSLIFACKFSLVSFSKSDTPGVFASNCTYR